MCHVCSPIANKTRIVDGVFGRCCQAVDQFPSGTLSLSVCDNCKMENIFAKSTTPNTQKYTCPICCIVLRLYWFNEFRGGETEP